MLLVVATAAAIVMVVGVFACVFKVVVVAMTIVVITG